jgi:hypothetical protein
MYIVENTNLDSDDNSELQKRRTNLMFDQKEAIGTYSQKVPGNKIRVFVSFLHALGESLSVYYAPHTSSSYALAEIHRSNHFT